MWIVKAITQTVAGIRQLLFVPMCLCCGAKLRDGQRFVCVSCRIDLPITEEWKEVDNPLFERFAEYSSVVGAASFFYYHKQSRYSMLIHRIKFNGERYAGEMMGRWFGQLIATQSNLLEGVDVLLPMPLHRLRRWYRGYNQSEYIAMGIATQRGIPVDTCSIKRTVNTSPQTHKNGYWRRQTKSDVFRVVDPLALSGKHIALVDDVITTGSSIRALIEAIDKAAVDCRITILSLSSVR